MAGCGCSKKRNAQKYIWYKDESDEPRLYSLIEAKAKVMRKGGRYIPYVEGVPIGTQIANAEAARVNQR